MKNYLGLSLIAAALLMTGCGGGGSSESSVSSSDVITDTGTVADDGTVHTGSTDESEITTDGDTDSGSTDGDGTDSTPTYTAYPYDAPPISENEKSAFLAAVNDMRLAPRDCGSYGIMPAADPLTWNDALYKAAYEHNEDMAEADYDDHTGSGQASDWTAQVQDLGRGSTPEERAKNNGYNAGAGENIWASPKTLETTIDGWMASDGHCYNIMWSGYSTLGMSHYVDDTSRWGDYWTALFGE